MAHGDGPRVTRDRASTTATLPSVRSWQMHAVLAVAILTAVGSVVAWSVRDTVANERSLITMVVTHKARVLETWLAERMASAALSGTSFPQAELYARWRDEGDANARELLVLRLQQFAEAGAFSNVALLAPSFEVLWSSEALVDDITAWTHAAWPTGAIPGDVTRLEADWREPTDVMLAIAVALPTQEGTPAPVAVFTKTVDDVVSAEFRRLGVPVSTTRISVFRSTESGPVGVSGSVEDDGAPMLAWHRPWSDTDAPAVRLAMGTVEPLEPVAGVDERGATVVAAGRSVDDMPWHVLAQRDSAAVWASAYARIGAGALAAVSLYLAALIGWTAVRRRQTRTLADTERRRARAQQLLEAIANASPDAIFVKDLEGRYVLFNLAASGFVGRSADEVLGHDDRALFPAEQAAAVMENERRVMTEGHVITFDETVETAAGERVFSATKGPLYAGDGRLIGTYGISRDVTERVRMERASAAQAHELTQTVADLERFNRVLIDRELDMIELKRRVNAAMRELGKPEPYTLPVTDGDEDEPHG